MGFVNLLSWKPAMRRLGGNAPEIDFSEARLVMSWHFDGGAVSLFLQYLESRFDSGRSIALDGDITTTNHYPPDGQAALQSSRVRYSLRPSSEAAHKHRSGHGPHKTPRLGSFLISPRQGLSTTNYTPLTPPTPPSLSSGQTIRRPGMA